MVSTFEDTTGPTTGWLHVARIATVLRHLTAAGARSGPVPTAACERARRGIRPMDKDGLVRLTNDSYLITMRAGSGVERYYRHGARWVKLTTRGRRMPATAEQVLNHLLPALAGVKPGVTVQVEHRDLSVQAGELLDELRTSSGTD